MSDQALKVPTHVGFIMDGNRRWARMHTIPDMDGHLSGYTAMKEVLEAAYDKGIQYVTLYAFSSENWSRQSKEVSGLMKLMVGAVAKDIDFLIKKGVRVVFLGRRTGLGDTVIAALDKAEAATAKLTHATLAVCFNYGGKQEIVDAVRGCMHEGLTAEQIDEQAIADHLYAPDIPPIDIIVRTSGEHRLSNFMLWRAEYSELYFLEKYWPDMTKEDVADIIVEYNKRQRRFGG
ncbi:MAG TPA: polyprenyl diphosphate synthase [Candidatus Saccharimonadales bacterium]|nr:polyprenyl diphosphate synthase [Candidatus Saccharimonadales bacterium]